MINDIGYITLNADKLIEVCDMWLKQDADGVKERKEAHVRKEMGKRWLKPKTIEEALQRGINKYGMYSWLWKGLGQRKTVHLLKKAAMAAQSFGNGKVVLSINEWEDLVG